MSDEEVKSDEHQGLSKSGRPSLFRSKTGALRVVLFFARNPEEELTSADITMKFDIPADKVHGTLNRAARDGMLRRAGQHRGGRGRVLVYSAGDALLALIGERRLVEDRRAEDRETPDRRVGASMMALVVEACAPLAGAGP